MTDAELTHQMIGAAIEVHRALGPGLLESAYEECLARELTVRAVPFDRQKPLPLVYKDVKLDSGYRLIFLWIGGSSLSLRQWSRWAPIHEAIVLTYLRLSGCKIGLLINFNAAVLKDGIRRLVNGYEG